MRTKLRNFGITVMAFFMLLSTIIAIAGTGVFAKADGAEQTAVSYSAVDALRSNAEDSGWSVATFDGTTLTAVETAATTNYTYYTLQVHSGYAYTKDSAMAFVPDKLVHTLFADCLGPRTELVNSEKYSVVLVNDETNKMAIVYTASTEGTLYYQDLAQVAPLHFDESANAGVYGEYRIVKVSASGEAAQIYPATGNHELYAANAAPTTSAWVNSSVEMSVGDKLVFVSEKAGSTVFSSPVVSYTEFEEIYELKNFWKWQQINDANYFEVGYRNSQGVWTLFPNLETKKTEFDIYPRNQAQYQSVMYWGNEYVYALAFGGMWVHAGETPSTTGVGDVGYAFKVPHSGYVNIDLNMIGHYLSEVEIWHNDTKLYETTSTEEANIFHYGVTCSQQAVSVKEGDVLYFVQTSEQGPSPQELNPVITYIDEPYTIDKTEATIDEEQETTLTLELNDEFSLDAANVVWSAATDGIVELTANGASVTVKGVKAGQTVVLAKVGDYAAVSCEITVNAINKFTIAPLEASVEEESTTNLTVTMTSDSITAEDIIVTIEDDSIATATVSGTTITVTGVSKGTTELYVQADGSKSVTVLITVTEKTTAGGENTSGGNTGNENKPGDNAGETPTDKPEEETRGCGSSISYPGIAFASLAVLGAATVILKKKNILKD